MDHKKVVSEMLNELCKSTKEFNNAWGELGIAGRSIVTDRWIEILDDANIMSNEDLVRSGFELSKALSHVLCLSENLDVQQTAMLHLFVTHSAAARGVFVELPEALKLGMVISKVMSLAIDALKKEKQS